MSAPAGSLIDQLLAYQLLTQSQIENLAPQRDGTALLREAVRRGWLTVFQSDLIARGTVDRLAYGTYRLIDRLGSGGNGHVYRAWDVRARQSIALKVIKHSFGDNPEFLSRFRREARVARKLTHPNIVRTFDAHVSESGGFLAMELLDGSDLSRVLAANGPLELVAACNYTRQAAMGLQHAHTVGLVHRDVKPGNLMLTSAGVVKLLDLGLVRMPTRGTVVPDGSAVTQEGAVLGTADYMAPEQARDPRGVDTRADVYALGCTLYELLAGRPPFDGGTQMQKLLRHQREEARPIVLTRRDVPPKIGAVVARMLAKSPADRFNTPGEVAAALV
jgi:serine/threonine protein kinase